MPRAQPMPLVLLAGAVLSGVASCGGADGGEREEEDRREATSQVRVSAAASLTDAFSEMESAFEATRPAIDVLLNLGGSSALSVQILEGAPVDVFAAADTSIMQPVVEAGEVDGNPAVLARNLLQIAVPSGNPGGVTGVEDFSDNDLVIGLCAQSVPCGELARRALIRAGVTPAIDTNEPDARALLTKVELGEIDAGITYVTDVIAADGAVEGIDLPPEVNVSAEYSIAVLASAPNPDAAAAFVEFVLSDAGQAILESHGFDRP